MGETGLLRLLRPIGPCEAPGMSAAALSARRRIAVAVVGILASVTGVVVVVSSASRVFAEDWCSILPIWPGCHS